MAKKMGLGKGINSLISETALEYDKNEEKAEVKEIIKEVVKEVPVKEQIFIKVRDIEPGKGQPRKDFDDESLKELTQSVKQYGVISPLLLRKKGEHYEIIAGERRWRAAKAAGIKEVPAVIKEYTDQQMAEVSLIENIQRENLNPVEEAMAYRKLADEFGLKQDEIADRVSKSRVYVSNSMRLLKLNEEVLNYLSEGKISTGHAKVLLEIDNKDKQTEAAKAVAEKNMSVRETEKMVKKMLSEKPALKKEELTDANVYESIEKKLTEKFSTKVKINRSAKEKGRLEIEYYSGQELERILEIIGI